MSKSIKKPQIRINWNQVQSWANYFVVQGDETGEFFAEKPTFHKDSGLGGHWWGEPQPLDRPLDPKQFFRTGIYFHGIDTATSLQQRPNKELWRAMFSSKEWLKPTKKNLAKYLPEKNDGKTNTYLAVIGRDNMGEFAQKILCFDLKDGYDQMQLCQLKKFLPIDQAAAIFPAFFSTDDD